MDEVLFYYKTFDYDKFKKIEFNRDIKLKKLEKQINENDFSKYVPIIVTNDFYIIDGQHRYNVLKKKSLPIYYIIAPVTGDEVKKMMISLNTTTRVWKQEEWLHYYCANGNITYIKFDKLIKQNNIPISNGILLFSNGMTNSDDFKKGKLKDNSEYFIPVIEFINNVQLPSSSKWYRAFVAGVLRFFEKYYNTDKKRIEKLRSRCLAVPKFAKIDDYIQAFENLTSKSK